MYQYSIAQHILPKLSIEVKTEATSLSLPQIILTYPAHEIDNGEACQAFESYLQVFYALEAREDDAGARRLVLNPRASSLREDEISYLSHFVQHMAGYYGVSSESVYERCLVPALKDAVIKRSVKVGQELTDSIKIYDRPDTTDIEIFVGYSSLQSAFTSWIKGFYVTEEISNDIDGSLSLTLKGLKGTHDVLSKASHLVQLSRAIHNAWGAAYDDILSLIEPEIARNYTSTVLSLRKNAGAKEPSENYVKDIIIVGGGFSAVSTAKRILEDAKENPLSGPIRIQFIEKNPDYMAGGIAYGAARPEHRVNVAAQYLSVDPTKPNDFVEWLKNANHSHQLGDEQFLDIPEDFSIPTENPELVAVQRRLYHYYLIDRLAEIIDETSALDIADVDLTFSEAIATDLIGNRVKVYLKNGQVLEGDDLILANGHGPVNAPPFLDSVKNHERVVFSQWAQEDQIDNYFNGSNPDIKKVALLGTGLSSMDIVVTAFRNGFFDNPDHHIVLISRGGHLHKTLVRGQTYQEPVVDLENYREILPHSAEEVSSFAVKIFSDITTRGNDDIGRTYTSEEVFAALTRQIPAFLEATQIDQTLLTPLLRQNSSLITTTAVSMAPEIGEIIEKLLAEGRISVLAADPKTVQDNNGSLKIDMMIKGALVVMPFDALISALPPQSSPQNVPILKDMMDKGFLRPDPVTNIGLDVSQTYQAINQEGAPIPNLHIVGPVVGGHEIRFHGLIGPPSQIVSGLRPEAGLVAEDIMRDCRERPMAVNPTPEVIEAATFKR